MKTNWYKKMFNFVNQELFDNMLDMPEIYVLDDTYIKKAAIDWELPLFDGVCVYDEERYFLGMYAGLNEVQSFNTLVHEMIHMYTHRYHREYLGHGGWFRVYCEKAYEIFYRV